MNNLKLIDKSIDECKQSLSNLYDLLITQFIEDGIPEKIDNICGNQLHTIWFEGTLFNEIWVYYSLENDIYHHSTKIDNVLYEWFSNPFLKNVDYELTYSTIRCDYHYTHLKQMRSSGDHHIVKPVFHKELETPTLTFKVGDVWYKTCYVGYLSSYQLIEEIIINDNDVQYLHIYNTLIKRLNVNVDLYFISSDNIKLEGKSNNTTNDFLIWFNC